MALPYAQIESIMVIIGDVFMLFAKRSVVTEVETGFVIKVLCENRYRYEGKQNKQ